MLENSFWDDCLIILAGKADLSPKERDCFFLRFAERHKKIFQASITIEEGLATIYKEENFDQILASYKKHMSQVYRKCSEPLGIKYTTINKKDRELFEAVKTYIQRFRFTSKNLHEKFSNVIQNLDYLAQESEFKEELSISYPKAKAFFLEVSYDNENGLLQKILMRRLCRFLTFKEIPGFYDLKITEYWQNNSIRTMCEEFSKKYNLNTIELDDLISFFSSRSETQPLIISLRNIPAMGSQLCVFLNEFWYPLVESLEGPSHITTDFRLLLLLSGVKNVSKHFDKEKIGCPKSLSPLNFITKQDVRQWLGSADVHSLIRDCKREDNNLDLESISMSKVQESPLATLGDSAYEAMGIISEAFGFSKDLYQFEPYWELTGDAMI
jgi:hypothetical protein